MQIVMIVAIHRGVRRSHIEMRSFHDTHGAPLGDVGRGDVSPALALVFRQLNVSVVGSNPYHSFSHLGRSDRQDRPSRLLGILLYRPPARQISAPRFPTLSP